MHSPGQARHPHPPCSPFPLALVQEGGGEAWGRTTGAKALFCFTAEMTLAGENEKMPCVLLQFEGRVTEEAAMVGLDGTTATKQTRQHAGPARGRPTNRTTRFRLGRALETGRVLGTAGAGHLCPWRDGVGRGGAAFWGATRGRHRDAQPLGPPFLLSSSSHHRTPKQCTHSTW